MAYFISPTASEWQYFVKGGPITSFPIINSLWVTFHILWWQSHHTFLMTDRKWVTLHFLWMAVLPHLLLWLTDGEWHWTFCDKGSLIPSFPMTNRWWVNLHILWKAVLWHLFLLPAASEWYCTFCKSQYHDSFLSPTESEWHCTLCEMQATESYHLFYHKQLVSDIAHFVKQCHQTFSHDQQFVSNIVHFLLTIFPMTIEQRVSHIGHYVRSSLISVITLFPMTNSEWVALYILWNAVSSQLFLWQTGCEWCIRKGNQRHDIFSYI